METDDMKKWSIKKLFEYVVEVLESSETKEEALEKLKSLPILKSD